jgi:hypothetical protein
MLLAVWLARLSDYVTVVLRKKKLVKHGWYTSSYNSFSPFAKYM